jgi:hypothetical protein
MLEDRKIPISFRIPSYILDEIKKRSEKRNVSITDIFIDALEFYLGDELPGLCFKCKSQNPPEIKFCLTCGNLLSQQRKDFKTDRTASLAKSLSKPSTYDIDLINRTLDEIVKNNPDLKGTDLWKKRRDITDRK